MDLRNGLLVVYIVVYIFINFLLGFCELKMLK